jgi:N6-adenosine-specific RNA methylase IME4
MPSDEGGLKAALCIAGNFLRLDFGKPVTWLAMTKGFATQPVKTPRLRCSRKLQDSRQVVGFIFILPEHRGDRSRSQYSAGEMTMNTLPGITGEFGTILADPPWQFDNRTGKVAPEHRRLRRYPTMNMDEIRSLPVEAHAAKRSHLYLWCPNALLREGLSVLTAWGFTYKTALTWYKVRKDGGPDGRGVGFYFRNVTEVVLFGVKGSMRTLAPGRRQVNLLATRKREHSRKPDELYDIIEACSPGTYLELFARAPRERWHQFGDEVETYLQNRKIYSPAYVG